MRELENKEFSFYVNPVKSGKIDFTKFALTLSCNNCNNDKLFNKSIVKAMDAEESELPVYVYNIIIFPAKHERGF